MSQFFVFYVEIFFNSEFFKNFIIYFILTSSRQLCRILFANSQFFIHSLIFILLLLLTLASRDRVKEKRDQNEMYFHLHFSVHKDKSIIAPISRYCILENLLFTHLSQHRDSQSMVKSFFISTFMRYFCYFFDEKLEFLLFFISCS
jgi:hypothetical protein